MKKTTLLCLTLFCLNTSHAARIPPKTTADLVIKQSQQSDFVLTHPNRFQENKPWILVGIKSQRLKHYDHWGRLVKNYVISTATRGAGEVENTYQTPRGHHTICEKFGENAEIRTIFTAREETPWRYSMKLHEEYPKKDWILTRIMWLCGQEEGKNKGTNEYGQVVDSYQRYIYIHGAGDHTAFGTPSSLGCVRMQNEEVIELFNQVGTSTDVYIDENL